MQAIIAKVYSAVHARSALSKVSKVIKNFKSSNIKEMSNEGLKLEFNNIIKNSNNNFYNDDVVIPLFSLIYEAIFRLKGFYLHECQLEGSFLLLSRRVAEMKTGEGKTITIVPAAIIHAIANQGVHIVTANEYLAKRDADLMRPVFEFFGLTCFTLLESMTIAEKQSAYNGHVTYGVASAFGFDYLRDNLVMSLDNVVQRPLYAAIVDEVDSILIDDARTPLIISKKDDFSHQILYSLCNLISTSFQPAIDYILDFTKAEASFSEQGFEKLEKFFIEKEIVSKKEDLYSSNAIFITYASACLKACSLYTLNKDYIVTSDNKIALIDSGTGRILEGRRLNAGIHEALEAKENLPLNSGTKSTASISFQNFFSMYARLSGLSGTALTESNEFSAIYNLEVVEVPTHQKSLRVKHEDRLFFTKKDKFDAIVELILSLREKGQPVLVGTESVRDADLISAMLSKIHVPHNLLTAKFVDKEALIVADAGSAYAVTIATNMAGRGTDIILGGDPSGYPEELKSEWKESNEMVKSLGGLYVIGASRNTIRRVDNQLLGRCARQGDPGEFCFFSSLQDELFTSFEDKFTEKLNAAFSGATEVSGPIVNKFVNMAQIKFENMGFSQRDSLMKYDKINTDQQNTMFGLRRSIISSNHKDIVKSLIQDDAINYWIQSIIPNDTKGPESLDYLLIKENLNKYFNIEAPVIKWANSLNIDEFRINLFEAIKSKIESSIDSVKLDSNFIIDRLDFEWSEHLFLMQELNQNISYRSLIGKNPVFEYSNEGFALFESFINTFKLVVISDICNYNRNSEVSESNIKSDKSVELTPDQRVAIALRKSIVGRNDVCPCGSGHKFKNCHGIKPGFF